MQLLIQKLLWIISLGIIVIESLRYLPYRFHQVSTQRSSTQLYINSHGRDGMHHRFAALSFSNFMQSSPQSQNSSLDSLIDSLSGNNLKGRERLTALQALSSLIPNASPRDIIFIISSLKSFKLSSRSKVF
jgi:hypothetical protein